MRGVTPQSLAATAALRDALRVALAPESPATPWTMPSTTNDDDFLTAIKRHRVFPLLARWPERFDFSDRLRGEINEGDKAERLNSLKVTQHLIRAHQALTDAGIRALAFKGPALAQLAYGDFTMRGTGDIDLLVSPDDLEAAYKTLEAAGWAGDTRMPRPGPSWAWRHLKRTYYEVSLHGPVMIDLHWHLINLRGIFPGFDAIWTERATVPLVGASIPTLNPAFALAHACSHSAKDDWSWLRSIADVYQLAANANTWHALNHRLHPSQARSLGIAGRSFGTPRDAPRIWRHCTDSVGRQWSRTSTRLAGETVKDRQGDVPGTAFVRTVAHALRDSRSPRTARDTAMNLIIPHDSLGSEEGLTFREALPGLVANRWRGIQLAIRRWKRFN